MAVQHSLTWATQICTALLTNQLQTDTTPHFSTQIYIIYYEFQYKGSLYLTLF